MITTNLQSRESLLASNISLHDTNTNRATRAIQNAQEGIATAINVLGGLNTTTCEQLEVIIKVLKESGDDTLAHISYLIQETGNINEKDEYGNTALTLTILWKYPKISKLLLDHPDILVNEKNYNNDTALTLASWRNDIEMIQLLVENLHLDFTVYAQGERAIQQTMLPKIRDLIVEKMSKKRIF